MTDTPDKEWIATEARKMLHEYGIMTVPYTRGGGDHPMMDFLIRFGQSSFDQGAARGTERERGSTRGIGEWMIAHGYVTGHGDTIADLLGELEAGVRERAARVARTAHERWAGQEPCPVQCDITACEEIANAILTPTPTEGERG